MELHFRPFELRLANPWTIARSLEKEMRDADLFRVVFVQLRDADGVVGLGESAPSSRYGETQASVQAWLGRVDPARLSFEDVAGSMAYLAGVGAGDPAARCALNLALLDGAARRAGRSVHEYLGLPFEEGRHVTSYSIGIDAPEVIRRKVAAAAEYPVLKLKVGAPGDRENLAALREVAPTKTVRVDGNEAWKTREEALRQIERLAADPHIELVEQPMPASTPVADLAWLKERSPLLLMADESYGTAADAERCAEGFHAVNVKLVKAGGISGGLSALQAARRAGLKTMLGCMIESSLLITAAAHLAAWTDYLDIDGNLLITNDPYSGVTSERGVISFRSARERLGLRVQAREGGAVQQEV